MSYRATTGDDPRGTDGAFAPGRRISLADVEKRDGTSFTAAFCERLVGDNIAGKIAPWNYAVVDGPSAPARLHARLPRRSAGPLERRRRLFLVACRLSFHPVQPRPAAKRRDLLRVGRGEAAFMGASSGHVKGVNLLMLDGSVKLVVPTIDPKVWKEFAAVSRVDESVKNQGNDAVAATRHGVARSGDACQNSCLTQ